MMENNLQNQQGTIDITVYLRKIIRFWYVYLFSVGIAWFLSNHYIKYQTKIYSASAKILLRGNGQSSNASAVLKEIVSAKGGENIENEILVLKSYDVIAKALRKLNFHVSYEAEGDIKTQELYKDSPYVVVLDTNHLQIKGVKFTITPIDELKFSLEAEGGGKTFYFTTDSIVDERKVKLKKTFFYDEPIIDSSFKFVISLKDKDWKSGGKAIHSFRFNRREDLFRKYKGKVSIRNMTENGSVLLLRVEEEKIQKGIDYLNALIEAFIELDLEGKNESATKSIKFIEEQLALLTIELDGNEKDIEQFRQNRGVIIDFDLAASNAYEQVLTFDKEKSKLLLQLKYYQSVLNYVKMHNDVDNIMIPTSMGIADPTLGNLIGDLSTLYSEKAALGSGIRDKHPMIEKINLRIKNARDKLIENLSQIINASELQLDDLNIKIGRNNKIITNLPKNERDLLALERRLKINDYLYNYLLEKKTGAEIARSLNEADNKILEQASVDSYSPVKPQGKRVKTIFMLLGLVIPLGLVILKEILNNKIQNREHLQRLTDTSILGIIGRGAEEVAQPLVDKPKSAVAESFRSLRVNLQYLRKDGRQAKVIGLTSSISGEGKTFCSMNLATALAINNSKVVVMGADLRKPRLGKELNVNLDIGLSSYLSSLKTKEEVIQETGVENLHIITAGAVPPNPGELLASDKMKSLVEELVNEYDFVIIDSSPVGLVSDYQVLVPLLDTTLYVVRNNYSTTNVVKLIDECASKYQNLNLILNDVDSSSSYGSYGGYGGQGYGYGYGGQGYGYYEEEKKRSLFSKIFGKK